MNAGRKHVLPTFISPTIVVYIIGWLRDELHNRSINGRLKVGVNKKSRQFLRLAALFFLVALRATDCLVLATYTRRFVSLRGKLNICHTQASLP
jgi:hypothetical protein